MADSPRDRMIDSAVKLLATQGFQGASFSSILEDSKAPRGSIYYHFPGGKDELILAALDRSGENARNVVEQLRGRPAADVVSGVIAMWRALLSFGQFRIGCSMVGATVSSNDDEIIDRAAQEFRAWEARLVSVLIDAGLPAESAASLGTLLIAASEGAVVLCRAEHSMEPLDHVERSLRRLAAAES